ncbi:ComEC/Rec2 family competence protein [Mycolicibacterium arenosum]|uniref:ComEC/Rec2 family competence protein n=1 Tax=Mycolicibacterium arenosum TaxID=2952157 RepID=A0ABT1M2Y3_9MYCO|nr:ComEC/Rec2 family competence protein [Mycolicibacterium sp. CAU 1645]MCP9273519.1 ComEC/Rec2 family competence protein [Mycolicibacterium sp. CAU 1645]
MTGGPRDAARVDLRLVPAAVTAWAVSATGILSGAVLSAGTVLAAAALTAAIGWWGRRGGGQSPPLWPGVVAVAAVGVAFGASVGLRVHDLERHPATARHGGTSTVVVTASETPRMITGGRVVFRGTLDAFDGQPSSGRVVVFAPVAGYGGLTAGRPAAFRAGVGAPTRRDLSVALLTASGEPRLGDLPRWQRAAAGVRADFAEQARAVLPADQAAMLPALVLGDTSAVDAATEDEFRTAGLTHLTAVSGANVTIVCGAVLLAAALVGPRAAAAAAALALVGFVAVVQPTASVLRAAIMGGIALLAVVSQRRRQAVPALAAAVLVSMIVAPQLAVDVGFVLSVAATAALVVIAPVWTQRLVDRGWPRPLAAGVAIALAAQLVTAPVVAGVSGAVSLVAVAANLAVAPVIPPITVLGTAAAAVLQLWPAAGRLLIRFTGPELWWLLHAAQWSAAVPGAGVPVPSGLTGAVLVAVTTLAGVLLWRWRAGRVVVLVLVLCAVAWAAGRGGAVGPP